MIDAALSFNSFVDLVCTLALICVREANVPITSEIQTGSEFEPPLYCDEFLEHRSMTGRGVVTVLSLLDVISE